MLLYAHSDTTLACPLRQFYPECFAYISGSPALHPMRCLRDGCSVGRGCADKLVPRLVALWGAFPKARRLLLYWKYSAADSLGAAIFRAQRDASPALVGRWNDDGSLIVLNRCGWTRFVNAAEVVSWEPPQATGIVTADEARVIPVSELSSQVHQQRST